MVITAGNPSLPRLTVMKQVVLVSLDWRRPQDGKTGLGIASIAASESVATKS